MSNNHEDPYALSATQARIQLSDLCESLEYNITFNQDPAAKRVVGFFSGQNPNYTVADRKEWIVTISVDGVVVFKNSHVYALDANPHIIESMLIHQVIQDVFAFGITQSMKIIKERLKEAE